MGRLASRLRRSKDVALTSPRDASTSCGDGLTNNIGPLRVMELILIQSTTD
ncbi:hypothetical protein RISK_006422 [Rhodopirellula islandica]|uniref:Uncharacterized protein n=1 Tax=Rhodopirellula islandica TaxID=595434 RepID=A0A0J1B402_RHOIS|nr:hypothetical protein RISK_006422 [Rhodopirellula islandica]